MYKTVRHGENSLQYKILAQQEDGGIPSVKRRRSTRGKTAGIITIVLLLVCGVIATAVLVPLVLTNDFITLTGTFQKFSVSTLHRSHSGNHVVVIAKKPHGWNSSRQSVLPPGGKGPNNSTNHANNKTKHTTIPAEPSTTIDFTGSYTATSRTTHREKKPTVATTPGTKGTESTEVTFTTKAIVPTTVTTRTTTTTKTTTTTMSADGSDSSKITEKKLVPGVYHKEEHHVGSELVQNLHESPGSPTAPSWYQNRKWNFDTPSSFISWSKNRISNNSLSTAVGGICAVSVIIIIIVVLVKSLPDRKRTIQKESAESKEDKKRLLKPSARTSDEE